MYVRNTIFFMNNVSHNLHIYISHRTQHSADVLLCLNRLLSEKWSFLAGTSTNPSHTSIAITTSGRNCGTGETGAPRWRKYGAFGWTWDGSNITMQNQKCVHQCINPPFPSIHFHLDPSHNTSILRLLYPPLPARLQDIHPETVVPSPTG